MPAELRLTFGDVFTAITGGNYFTFTSSSLSKIHPDLATDATEPNPACSCTGTGCMRAALQAMTPPQPDSFCNAENCGSAGGFLHGVRMVVLHFTGTQPADRIPKGTNGCHFGTNGRTSSRHAHQLQAPELNHVTQCDHSAATFTTTGTDRCPSHPTSAPVSTRSVPTAYPHGGEDDDFPGWAIALCVVLPVLAIGAAVAIYFFVCNKSEDNTDPNEPDNEPTGNKDEAV